MPDLVLRWKQDTPQWFYESDLLLDGAWQQNYCILIIFHEKRLPKLLQKGAITVNKCVQNKKKHFQGN